ncbi:hypothetical protein [Nocardia cyriacigeorgica]|uniref:hypothetical protein n=1 Tax=Nocardia cyriacigeorgica TaxID=135487 RepID=UPI002017EE4D|nr:hypothetical protein [Nocardia cyriacigeorgica]
MPTGQQVSDARGRAGERLPRDISDPGSTTRACAYEEDQVRSIKTGIAAVALAAATVAVAGPAQADEPLPGAPEERITIDINLLGCSIGAGLGVDLLLALTTGQGSSTTIGSGLATRLKMAGCLPW